MKYLELQTGFSSDTPRNYEGQHIFCVKEIRVQEGVRHFLLENNLWVKEIGSNLYQTEWNIEEFWGRVDEVEIEDATGIELSRVSKGYVLLHVDREKGLRLYRA
jgi:hypothetical protein